MPVEALRWRRYRLRAIVERPPWSSWAARFARALACCQPLEHQAVSFDEEPSGQGRKRAPKAGLVVIMGATKVK
ncbi:hypothetical protein HaLaN_19368, partial [Haematococcus lacustris]